MTTNESSPSSAGEPPEMNVLEFIGALGETDPQEREEQAMRFLHTAIASDGIPSPHARAHVESGEWEKSDVCVFVLDSQTVIDGICRAKIGTKTESEHQRFCCALRSNCRIASHEEADKVDLPGPGLYLSTSKQADVFNRPPTRGAYSHPVLPLGPPLDASVVANLTNREKPVTMSLGQFRYVFEEIERHRSQESSRGAIVRPAPPGIDTSQGVDKTKATDRGTRKSGPPTIGHEQPLPPVKEVKKPSQHEDAYASRDSTKVVELEIRLEQLEGLYRGLANKYTDLEKEHRTMDREVKHHISIGIHRDQQNRKVFAELRSGVAELRGGGYKDDNVEDRIGALEDLVENGNATIESILQYPKGRIPALEKRFLAMESTVELGGTQFGTLQFKSFDSFHSWVSDICEDKGMKASEIDYGLFQDAFSFLHNADPGTTTMSESLKTEHDVIKVKYSSKLAAQVSTSYSTAFPDIFGSGDGTNTDFGTAINTAAKWHNRNVRQGVSVALTDRIPTEEKSIQKAINSNLTGDLAHLAKDMLRATTSFVNDFVSFVDRYYLELKESSNVEAKEAWDIILGVISEIFREIKKARSPVTYCRVSEPLYHIWGALKAHEAMDRFKKAQFQDDPAVTGILVRSLVKRRSEADTIKDLSEKLGKLQSSVQGINAKVAKLKTP